LDSHPTEPRQGRHSFSPGCKPRGPSAAYFLSPGRGGGSRPVGVSPRLSETKQRRFARFSSWAGAQVPEPDAPPGARKNGGGLGSRGWHPGLHECRPCRGSVSGDPDRFIAGWSDRGEMGVRPWNSFPGGGCCGILARLLPDPPPLRGRRRHRPPCPGRRGAHAGFPLPFPP
jgi:hypothetical protein